jgi:hypothetical protein
MRELLIVAVVVVALCDSAAWREVILRTGCKCEVAKR